MIMHILIQYIELLIWLKGLNKEMHYHKKYYFQEVLRPPRGVCEAHLHQAYKTCVIGAILSQTYEKCMVVVPLSWQCAASEAHLFPWCSVPAPPEKSFGKGDPTIHSHRFVMGMLK